MTHDFDMFNLTFFGFGEYLAGFDVFFRDVASIFEQIWLCPLVQLRTTAWNLSKR